MVLSTNRNSYRRRDGSSNKKRANVGNDADEEEDWVKPRRQRRGTECEEENTNDGPLSWYKPRAYVTKYGGSSNEDRDAWLSQVKSALIRDSIPLDKVGHQAASLYLKGEAATWYQSTFKREHSTDEVIAWDAFESAFKARFYQEDKQAKALRLANQVRYTDLDDFLRQFASINTLYPTRDIMETTFNFAYKLPPAQSALCLSLVQHVPRDFQELYVRVRAWSSRHQHARRRSAR